MSNSCWCLSKQAQGQGFLVKNTKTCNLIPRHRASQSLTCRGRRTSSSSSQASSRRCTAIADIVDTMGGQWGAGFGPDINVRDVAGVDVISESLETMSRAGMSRCAFPRALLHRGSPILRLLDQPSALYLLSPDFYDPFAP